MSQADTELQVYLGQRIHFYLVDSAIMAVFWGEYMFLFCAKILINTFSGIHTTIVAAAMISL
jgi:hypothetical protein